MSWALYHARLYWVGMRGSAHVGQCRVVLTAPPHLPGLRIDGIDYVPEIGLRQVMPYADRWRDMTPDEVSAAQAVLERLVAAGQASQP